MRGRLNPTCSPLRLLQRLEQALLRQPLLSRSEQSPRRQLSTQVPQLMQLYRGCLSQMLPPQLHC